MSSPSRTFVTSLLAISTLFVTAPPGGGQVQWSRRAVISGYAVPGLVYDSARQRVVMLTGQPASITLSNIDDNEVWEWTGTDWAPLALGGAGYKEFFALAYDRPRQRLVRFGGWPIRSGDTWEWDGVQWLKRSSVNEPPPRERGAMVYDEARGRAVLFGGVGNSNVFDDTWEWDGNDWIQRSPANVPPARNAHRLAYDAARQRVVLFGGVNGSTSLGDTWEWDGSDWIQMSPASAPSARSGHGLAYDRIRQRVVLFGGNPPGSACCTADTWEWDGTDWEQQLPATSPSPRSGHCMAFDEVLSTVILFGGGDGNGLAPTSTWEWDGNEWRESPPAGPVARMYAAAAYDSARDRVVLFGGGIPHRDDTWEWDGAAWIERRPEVRPQARWTHAMAYDSRRGRVVLFGGEDDDGNPLGDTWEWDGAVWVQRHPVRSPPAQDDHVMAYDAARGRTVLLSALPNSDASTWEWDGTDWILRSGFGPGFRTDGTMAYDAFRQRTVFFGGINATNETWEWDGNIWTQMQPTQSPEPNEGDEMAFDAARARIVLSGGSLNDPSVWEWDGTDWTRRTPATALPLTGHVMAYHGGSERIVVVDGTKGGTWEYFTTEPASYTSLGSGCVGSAGVPTLAAAAFSRPWAEDDFQLELTQAPPGSMAILLLGISNAQWGGLTLPLDLSPLNMPGCTLYTSIQAQMGTVAAGGVATWSIPIGSAPSGTTFFTQALVFDPSANPRGLILSNAGTAVVGRR